MMIKTADGHASVTSQAQGNLNTVLGAVGTLGVLSNNNGCGNGGVLGSILGGRNNDGCECYERKSEALLREQVAVLTSQNFTREAATKAFTDSVTYSAGLNDKQAAIIEKLADASIAQGQELAVLKTEIKCTNEKIEREFQNVYSRMADGFALQDERRNGAIALEAERRKCGDDNIVAWTQGELYKKANYAQYINGTQVFCPDASICGAQCSCSTSTITGK